MRLVWQTSTREYPRYLSGSSDAPERKEKRGVRDIVKCAESRLFKGLYLGPPLFRETEAVIPVPALIKCDHAEDTATSKLLLDGFYR
jgi:hypothetical protein